MQDIKQQLEFALQTALLDLGIGDADIVVQEVPEGKSGDYGSPVAFTLARRLRANPAVIARDIASRTVLPTGIASIETVGPYINFEVERSTFAPAVLAAPLSLPSSDRKVVVEHTSINPNKEAHVGHLRNIVLGDACARLLAAAGRRVEVQNYIDDTGRQAAESLFAIDYFAADYRGGKKYDHWLGELYVRLSAAKQNDGEVIERGVTEVMHRLERGELREEIAKVVRAQLETCYALGVEYDLLVWESDVVQSGFLQRGLDILQRSDYVYRPAEGKYAGALVMDVSPFIPGLEEPEVVLVRSDGNAMYVAKDIGYQFWKVGLFEGLSFARFDAQPSGKPLYSSDPQGEPHPDGRLFAHGDEVINVIDVRQSHPQTIVRTALRLTDSAEGYDRSQHLAYEVVTLEGRAMSGRKGITLAIDDVIAEAVSRAAAVVKEKNPDLETTAEVARQVGVGALRFAMLKSEAKRIIDFRWEQALSLQGDSAPYVQYAHARACSILREAAARGVGTEGADWRKIGPLEVKLCLVLARFPEVIRNAARELAPHLVAQYALDLAAAWNAYYNHKDDQGRADTQVLRAEPGLREARLMLVDGVRRTLAAALELLGIEAPQKM